MRFCQEKLQNTVEIQELSAKSTIFQDFSLFNTQYLDTISKGDFNSQKFYEKS